MSSREPAAYALPLELLYRILDESVHQFHLSQSKSNLSRLLAIATTCRSFRSCCAPTIFRQIQCASLHRTEGLYEILTRSPALKKHIQAFTIAYPSEPLDIDYGESIGALDGALAKVLDRLSSGGHLRRLSITNRNGVTDWSGLTVGLQEALIRVVSGASGHSLNRLDLEFADVSHRFLNAIQTSRVRTLTLDEVSVSSFAGQEQGLPYTSNLRQIYFTRSGFITERLIYSTETSFPQLHTISIPSRSPVINVRYLQRLLPLAPNLRLVLIGGDLRDWKKWSGYGRSGEDDDDCGCGKGGLVLPHFYDEGPVPNDILVRYLLHLYPQVRFVFLKPSIVR